MHEWYDWNHNYQLPAYVDPYIPYAFSSERSMTHDQHATSQSEQRQKEEMPIQESRRIETAVSSEGPAAATTNASTDQIPKTSWESLSAALRLDIDAGSSALVDCIERDGRAILTVAESHSTAKDWQMIHERSRAAWRRFHADRQSTSKSMRKATSMSETTILLQLLLVMSSVHISDTARASRLLYRLLSDISFQSLTRIVMPQLPPIIKGLYKREPPLNVLSSLTPIFGKRRASGWDLSTNMRQIIRKLSHSVGDPIIWLHQHMDKVRGIPQPIRRQTLQSGIAEMALFFTLQHGSSRTICDLLNEIQRIGIPLGVAALASLSHELAIKGDHETALAVCSAIDIEADYDSIVANKIVTVLHELGKDSEVASLLIKTSHKIDTRLFLDVIGRSVEGHRQDVALRIISSHFPRLSGILAGASSEVGLSKAERQVLRRLYLASVKAGDIEPAEGFLRLLVDHGVPLHKTDFNVLLKACSEQNNATASHNTLGLMRQHGVYPDVFTYSTLMTVYANRKNFSAVQRTFDDMVRHGIVPDAIAYAILLNAYIEDGDWLKASQFWQQLPAHIQADRNVSNALLRGMMLLSVPFPEIYRVFLSASAQNHPDQRAWTILIQSACDGAHLSRARELYQDFKLLTHQANSQMQLDHFLASILVVGHIRYGEVSVAKRLYEEMKREGVMDTSVTYAAIIDAALKGNWPMSAARAKALAYRLLAESEALLRERHKRRGQPVENVVMPLLQSAIRDGEIEEVERLFALSLEKGNQPTTLLYTTLMDAYRRAGEHDRVQQVWNAIWKLVQEPEITSFTNSDSSVSRDRRLCIPLSIYIDAMSAAHRHQDILRVWAEMRQNGFGFDAQNWNHLAVALIRSGDVLRAFDIVENVLLKAQEEVSSREFVSIRPDAAGQDVAPVNESSIGDLTGLQEHLFLDPLHRPPNRRHEHRDDPVAYSALRMERMSKGGQSKPAGGLDFDSNIFEKWRPTDATWRPTFFTMATLERAYWDLEQGRSMSMLVAVGEEEGDVGANADEEPPRPAQRSSPFALISKINKKYAKTVSLVLLHRRKRDDAMLMRRQAQRDT